MHTLFISDLHIDASRPPITARFLHFLTTEAATADALYILGDLFESWVGDDAPDAAQLAVMEGLRTLTHGGVPCFVMRGNRDFLLGERFAAATGVLLLPDPVVLSVYGHRVLVMHGDALCTDDTSYQRLRATVRDGDWQRRFLALSRGERRTLAHTAATPPAVTDVNGASVAAVLRRAGTSILLHGHTHRPAIHALEVDGTPRTRIVLGDWYEQGSVLRFSRGGYELGALARGGSGASTGGPE